MAKYQVTYACGHTETTELFGKHTDREKRLAYLSTIDCPECYSRKQIEAAKAKSIGFPGLIGTEKQINWANQIRVNAISSVDAFVKMVDEMNPTNIDQKVVALAMINDYKTMLLSKTECRWWINNRNEFDFGGLRQFLGYIQSALNITDLAAYSQQVLANN